MEKLKILLVANGYMTNVLGVLKVHYELKEEYEKQGHQVDILDFTTIYPNGYTPLKRIFGKLYTYKFWMVLKKIANNYDVIDANIECVVYPKHTFNFNGVLLARSHGMRPVYKLAEKFTRYKQALDVAASQISFKTRIGDLYRSLQKSPGQNEFNESVKHADIVHCLNKAEYEYLINSGLAKKKLLLVPNGISDHRIEELNQSKTDVRSNSLCFIGAWTIRKGSKDIDEILSNTLKLSIIDKLMLIGGQYPKSYITTSFSESNRKFINIHPSFSPENLLELIGFCKVGIFPSYLEGFALAIIEQLACGIPIVAYKIPGSEDALKTLDINLLIEPGDTVAFAKKVNEILSLSKENYTELAEKCKQESRKYLLSNISKQFINAYSAKLMELKS